MEGKMTFREWMSDVDNALWAEGLRPSDFNVTPRHSCRNENQPITRSFHAMFSAGLTPSEARDEILEQAFC